MHSLWTLLGELIHDPPPEISPEIGRDASVFPGLDQALAADEEAAAIFRRLPPLHRRLLGLTQGIEILGNSYRLFGMDGPRPRSLVAWNRPETWKFAWRGRADPYLCVGESILGNQQAYRWDELGAGDATPVYELYAVTMEPVVTYESFAALLREQYATLPDDAYHTRIREARGRFGTFSPERLLVYVPSPLLVGGRVDVQELVPMDGATAMILNGDLASELADRTSLEGLEGLDTYQDEQGRERIAVRWATRPPGAAQGQDG